MLEEASRDSFVVQDVDVDTLRLMLDYLYLGSLLAGLFILFSSNLLRGGFI